MLQKNKLKIMNLFFEEPVRNFHLREISRLTKIAVTSVRNYLNELVKESLIKIDNKTIYPSYIANSENRMFNIYKQQTMLIKLFKSELIDHLEDELLPTCIVLFGSVKKGEYDKESDIDIFVQCDRKELNLNKFEGKLNHNINLLFNSNPSKLSKELFNNIANGIVLSGYLKVK